MDNLNIDYGKKQELSYGGLSTFYGYKVFSTTKMTEEVRVKIEKPKWLRVFEKIASWNPCNAELITPDYRIEYRPSRNVVLVGDRMIVHPSIAALISGITGV